MLWYTLGVISALCIFGVLFAVVEKYENKLDNGREFIDNPPVFEMLTLALLFPLLYMIIFIIFIWIIVAEILK